MILRRLNGEGLAKFEQFIDDLRNKLPVAVPLWLLDDASTSEPLGFSLDYKPESYKSRYDLGVDLVRVLDGQNLQSVVGDRGFWSWMALLLFDQLCPPRPTESETPKCRTRMS